PAHRADATGRVQREVGGNPPRAHAPRAASTNSGCSPGSGRSLVRRHWRGSRGIAQDRAGGTGAVVGPSSVPPQAVISHTIPTVRVCNTLFVTNRLSGGEDASKIARNRDSSCELTQIGQNCGCDRRQPARAHL